MAWRHLLHRIRSHGPTRKKPHAATARSRRALALGDLEERVMFSAAPLPMPNPEAAVVEVQPAAPIVAEDAAPASAPTDETQSPLDDAQLLDLVADAVLPAQTEALEGTREVIFVDATAPDHEQLVADLQDRSDRDFDVILLGEDVDGVAFITSTLAGYSDLDAVHIVSHGEDGALRLGNTWLNSETLGDYSDSLASWSEALGADADLLFYGCDLAAGPGGQAFVDDVAHLTGADVAASVNDTGFGFFGADWNLEYGTGVIETDVAFSAELQAEWTNVMAVGVDSTSVGTGRDQTLSISHTTNGVNRLMLVGVSMGHSDGDSVTSITYNGASLTRLGFREGPDGDAKVEIWALVAPSLGTYNVNITFSDDPNGNAGHVVGVMTFTGVDQSSPYGPFASRSGDDEDTSLNVSSGAGEQVFGVAAVHNETIFPGQTEYWNDDRQHADGSGSLKAATGSTTTLTWSFDDDDVYAVAGVSIRPVVNLPPTVSLTNVVNNIDENTSTATRIKIADIVITDDGDGTNVLSLSGTDAALFEIDSNVLYLKAGTALDYETQTSYSVTVNVDDASLPGSPEDTASHTLNVNDLNAAPAVSLTNVVNTIDENTSTATRIKIADIVVTDDGEGTNVLSLAGLDAADFEIFSGALYLRAGTVLDFETKTSYAVTVNVDDAGIVGSPEDSVNHTLGVNDLNAAPTVNLTNVVSTIDENTSTATRIKIADIVVTDDGEGTNVLSLSGTDAGDFEIDSNVLYLKAGTVLDYETQTSYAVTVNVDDAGIVGSPEDFVSHTLGVNDLNAAPTVSLTNVVNTIDENTSTATRIKIADIVVSDDGEGTNVLSLSGTDAGDFEIDSGVLYLSAGTVLDYEIQTSYAVTVNVDDAGIAGSPEDFASHTLGVNDLNAAPMVSLTNVVNTIDENTSTATRIKIADIVVSDDGEGTNVLSLSGTDAGDFEIDGNVLYLRAGTVLDYETQTSYAVTVNVDDAGIVGSPDDFTSHTLGVNDLNAAPVVSLTNVVNTIDENTSTATRIKIADIVVTDDGEGTNVLSLSGTDAGDFEIDGTELYLRSGTVLDYETQTSYAVTVNVDDASIVGSPDSFTSHTLGVNDLNAAATVSLTNVVNTIDENTNTATRIKIADIVVSDDGEGTNVLSLSGTDAGDFEIDGTELFLKAGTVLDYETQTSYAVTVEVDDAAIVGSPGDSAGHTLGVNDLNAAPTVSLTNVVNTIDENTSTATRIKIADIVVSDDGEGTNVLSLGGTDAADFEIDGNVLYLKAGTVLDYETQTSYTLNVNVDDAAIAGSPEDFASHTLGVNDLNAAPTVSLTNVVSNINENASTATRVKIADIVVSDDGEGTNVLSLSGTDAAVFEIDSNVLYLRAGTVLDHETTPSYDVTVNVDDAGIAGSPDDSVNHTLNVTDVNMPPTVSLTNVVNDIDENTSTATRIKIADIVVTDDGEGTNVLSLSGADAGDFEIDGTELFLKAGTVLDHETKSSYAVTVNVDDAGIAGTPEDSVNHTLTINDANLPPSVSLTNVVNTIDENTSTATRIKIADIVVTDDGEGTNVLSLTGTDSGDFEIDGTELFLKAGTVLDYETQTSYAVTVNVDDAGIAGSPEDFVSHTLGVNDLNAAPTVSLTNVVNTIDENTSTATRIKVADIVVTDDGEGANVLSLSGTDAGDFEIDSGVLYLKAGTVLDYETQTSYAVTVEVDDAAIVGSPEDSVSHTLGVNDLNAAASVSLTNVVNTIDENTSTAARIKIADIVVSDDGEGTNVLSLSGTDAADFEIDGNVLYLKAGTVLDYETQTSYAVAVDVDDAAIAGSPEDSANHTLGVNDLNAAASVSLTNVVTAIDENTSTATRIKIADIVVTDDGEGTNVLSLSGTDAGDFEIDSGVLYLKAGTVLDYETQTSFAVTVNVDDAGIAGSPEDFASHTLGVNDLNAAPTVSLTNVVNTIDENTSTATRIKIADIVVTDDGEGTNVLSLSGTDAGDFEIDGNELFLRAGTVLDYETQTSYAVTVDVDDAGIIGSPDSFASHNLGVNDLNAAPTVSLTNVVNTIDENTSTATRVKIADIVVSDDGEGANVLSLSGTDAGDFEIDGNVLYLKAGTVLDYETQTSYAVTVDVDDAGIVGSPEDSASHTLGVNDLNAAPTLSLTNVVNTIDENTSTATRIRVADIVVTDDGEGTNVLSLSGTDASDFEIDGNMLYLRAGTVLDYETQTSYAVTVNVDDAGIVGSPEDFVSHTLGVNDLNAAPVVSLTNVVNDIDENTSTATRIKIADIVVSDDGEGTNVLSLSGTDAGDFEIDGSELFLRAGTVLDYETQTSYAVTVNVDDGGIAGSPEDFVGHTLAVNDLNAAPTVSLTNVVTTIDENTSTATRIKIADIVVTDDGEGTNVLSLSGTDAGDFEIDGNELFLRAGTVLDYETQIAYAVTVNVDDATIAGSPDAFVDHMLNVNDLNAPPTVSLTNVVNAIAENTSTATRIKIADIVITDDGEGTNTLALSGADAADFEIDGNVLYLRAGTTLDFEAKPSFDVTVEVDDGACNCGACPLCMAPDDTVAHTLAVNDLNAAPTVSLTNVVNDIDENTSTATRIKIADIVVADDGEGTNVLSLSGTDAGDFEIDGTELFLRAGTVLDYETQTSYAVTVNVDDAGIAGSPEDFASHTLGVNDLNAAPTVSLTNVVNTIDENTSTATRIKIADIVVTDDGEGTNVLSLSGTDAGDFEIDGTELFLRAGTVLDFETQTSYGVTVNVDDAGIAGSPEDFASHTLAVNDLNAAPTVSLTNVVNTIDENTSTATRIKIADIVVTDDGEGTNVLSLSGTDAGDFEIDGNELFLRAGTVLDFETQTSYGVTVNVDDAGIAGSPEDFASHTLAVNDLNAAPTVSLTNVVNTIDENTSTATRIKIADIVVTDDGEGTNVLSLSGTDAGDFEIDGNELFLRAGTVLDFETQTSYGVTVNVDDAGIAGSPEDFASHTLAVNDLNAAPTVSLTNVVSDIDENTSTATRIKIADIVVNDDGEGTNVLSLSGTDAGDFEIDGTELFLRAGTVLDFETQTSYGVTVNVDDAGIAGSPEDFASHTLGVNDLNAAPTVSLNNVVNTIDENTSTATRIKIADIVVTDDGEGTNVLSLSGTDAGDFEIDGNELFLRAGTVLDFETQTSYGVTVNVDDAGIAGSPEDFASHTLAVNDLNAAPTVSLTNVVSDIDENTSTATRIKIADIVVNDDGEGTNVLSLSGTDAGDFEIDGTELFLRAGTVLDFETQTSYGVTVNVDDAGIAGSPEDFASHTLGVNDLNAAPTVSLNNVVNTIDENTSTATRIKIADIVVTDDGEGTNVLSLSGTDAGDFEIDGTELFLRAGTVLDFETQTSYGVTVNVDDAGIAGSPEDFASHTLAVNDLNAAPTVSLTNVVNTIDENTSTATRIKIADIVVTDDGEGTNVLSLSGTDAGDFEIDGTELFLRSGTVLDFETQTSYGVTVNVDDAGIAGSPEDFASHTLAVNDLNAAPTVSLTNVVSDIDENTSTATRIKIADIVVNDDGEGTNVLSLSGTDAADFEIDGTELFLRAGTVLDFETQTSYGVTVNVDDAVIAGSPEDFASHTLAVNDLNAAPTVTLTNVVNDIDENTSTATRIKIADIVVNDDGEGTNVLSLSGTDAADFEIDGTELFLRAGTVLDFETQTGYSVTVNVDDAVIAGSPEDFASHTLAVNDLNAAPTVTLTNVVNDIDENTSTATRVKIADIVVTDDGEGTNVLSLSGTDAGDFELDGTELFLRAGTVLDFETQTSYGVTVNVDDAGIAGSPEDFASHTLAVNDLNAAPTVTLTNVVSDIDENTSTAARIKIADIVVTDDGEGTNVLSLSGTDAADFEIDGTELFLRAGTVLDFETQTSYAVGVNVDDPGLVGVPEDFVSHRLSVNDLNAAPTVSLTNVVNDIDENTSTATRIKIADIVVTDDGEGTNAFSLSGADAGDFEIDGNELFLSTGTVLDFESQTSYAVTVNVDDASIAGSPEDFVSHTLAVNDLNAAPAVSLTNVVKSIDENTATDARIRVADVVVTDDGEGANSLSLSGADAAHFELDGNSVFLRAGTTLDFETQQNYFLRVDVDDPGVGGAPDDAAGHTLQVNDLNAPATVSLKDVVTSIDENTDTSTRLRVADIVVTDDGEGVNALSLDGADAGDFEIDGTTLFLRAGTVLDFESRAFRDVTVAIDDTQVAGTPDDAQTHRLHVADLNETPVVENPVDPVVVDEDADPTQVDLMTVFSDVDIPIGGDTLTFTVVSSTAASVYTASVTGDVLTLQYLENQFGGGTVVVRATDSGTPGLFVEHVIDVTVRPVNDVPVGTDDVYMAVQLETLGVVDGVLLNDADIDGDPMTASMVRQAEFGTVELNADGSFTYTPDTTFHGTDSFEYSISDGELVSDPITVTIEVEQAGALAGMPTPQPEPEHDVPEVDPEPDQSSGSGGESEIIIEELDEEPLDDVPAENEQVPGRKLAAEGVPAIIPILLDTAEAPPQFAMELPPESFSNEIATLDDYVPQEVQTQGGALKLSLLTPAGVFMADVQGTSFAGLPMQQVVAASTTAVVTGLSVGYVIWLVRGGTLLASMLSALPAWAAFDPLPVLACYDGDGDQEDEGSFDALLS